MITALSEMPGKRRRLGLAALILAATWLLFAFDAFAPVEHRLTAMRAALLDRPSSGEIAIVEIDARSLAKLQTWPWSRRYHAGVTRQLNAAGADIIAFDVDFSALSEPVGDRQFAEALRDAEPVILPIFQQRASDQAGIDTVLESRPASVFGSAWVGGVNIFPGSDGVVRDYPAATMIKGTIRPSVSALLAENDAWGDRSFQPDWSIDTRSIPRFSFVDVLEGRIARDAVAGKRILIGATAIELGDRYTIPRYGVVPGVVIQALAADSLLQGRAISRPGTVPTLIATILVVLALCAGRFTHFRYSFTAAASVIVAILIAAPILIQSAWPISVDTVAPLFAALLGIASRVVLRIRRNIALARLKDTETGLPNRLMLEADLAADTSNAVLATAAIERFDSIRDAIGMDAVTEMVRQIAGRIEAQIAGPVYRIAPDIVAWRQPDETDAAIGARIVSITLDFRKPVDTNAGRVDIGLTVGLDRDPAGIGPMLKIERALAAISTAREAGDICHWYQGPKPDIRREISLMGDLRRGLAEGEVTLAYQPKCDLSRGTIADAEALVRWHHRDDGFIPPDRFVPLAESTGVIRELTDFALRTALADCARWQSAGIPMRTAVNISAADIATFAFVGRVEALVAEYGLAPRCLTLEVTESAIIRSPEMAISVLTALRAFGVRLSIDDYGTGQSTLSYLKQLPVHELKIDKSFVTSLRDNQCDMIMVRSSIQLAHDLGLQVVAEGIEDLETMNLLRDIGCDYGQGYFIGKPMTFSDLSVLATSSKNPLLQTG